MNEVLQFARTAMKKYMLHGFWILLPQAIGIIISLSVLPIILRHLPVSGYGMLQFIISVQVWSTVLSAGQITLSAKRGIVNGMDGTFLYAFLYRMRFLLVVGGVLLLSSLCIILEWPLFMVERQTAGFLLGIVSIYLMVGFLPQVSFPEYFIAKRSFTVYALWQIALSLTANIGGAIAAMATGNIIVFAFVQFGAYTLVSLSAFFWILFRRGAYRAYVEKKIDAGCVSYGLRLIPADIAVGTAGQVGSMLIGAFFGFAAVAVFSVATRLDGAVRNVIGALYNLLYSEIAQKGGTWSRDIFQKRLASGFILSLIVSAVCAGLGVGYISWFMPPEYQSAAKYFLILAASFPVAILQVILHTILETDLRHKEITVVTVVPNIVKIIFVFFGGLWFDILGVCLAIAIATWISFFFYYTFTFKRAFSYPS